MSDDGDLSQARIKPGYVLAADEIEEPGMSEQDWKDFDEGIRLFNAGEYWESHEAWEHVWNRCTIPSRVFFQALIQFSAACHQLERGVFHGVIKHFRNAGTKLAPFPSTFLGIDVDEIRGALKAGEAAALELGEADLHNLDPGLIPTITRKT